MNRDTLERIVAPLPLAFPDEPEVTELGHYIGLTHDCGFRIPEADFQLAQVTANCTGRTQFVGGRRAGGVIHADREALLVDPECNGIIAWITPRRAEQGSNVPPGWVTP